MFYLSFFSLCLLGKKKQLHVDKPHEDLVGGPYDAMDDDDFM